MLTKSKILFLTVAVLLFTGILPVQNFVFQALAQQSKQASINGFRSAKFGMSKNAIFRSIKQDFNVSKSKVKFQDHPLEKTVSMEISVDDLLQESGPSRVFYILGHRSKSLIQVNILWGKPVGDKFEPEAVVNTANQLRSHFVQKNFPKEGLVVNQPLNKEGTVVLVFRGKDKRGRMVLLVLENPKLKNADGKDSKDNENLSLKLSYIKNPDSPDVFIIRQDDF